MGVYGYCVLPADCSPAAGQQGIDGSAVRPWVLGALSVWVSDIDRPEPNAARIQAHNGVVESAITDQVTPVPLRFGQWSAESSAFASALLARADWYRERLTVFAGALEFGLRIALAGSSPARVVRVPEAETGTAYMEALRARTAADRSQREAAEKIRARVAEVVQHMIREERFDDATAAQGIVSMAHLVGRADFDSYRAAVQRLRSQEAALRFMLSGPWAPYSFAT